LARARENLRFAASTLERLQAEHPDRYAALVDRTGLHPGEMQEWKRAADAMYIPFEERMGIHLQDDQFLEREVWNFDATPPEQYPLLLYNHPLVIYRHQVIKQPDVVMAMFLLGGQFSAEQKRRNFDYYDPLTTGDSSLAACIQSIMAAEVGYPDKAAEYYRYASLMDLADVGGNVQDGAHIASMGGTWMAVVYGLAGMRDYGGDLSFDPRLAEGIDGVRFRLTVRDQLLEVDIMGDRATYRLVEGSGLTIRHREQDVALVAGQTVQLPLRAARPRQRRGA
jgi:alpha,alpha-trehalose phosphorylase